MNKTFFLLSFAAVAALLSSACIIDDSGYGYSDGYYDDYPPPRYDRYDDRYDRRYDRRYDDRRDDRYYDRDRRGGPRRHHDDERSARHGEFQAGGSAKEFSFPEGNTRCTITVVDGAVGFRTIVVRRGGSKQSITINATHKRGQAFDVPIDRSATGIRVSDTGSGRYRIAVH